MHEKFHFLVIIIIFFVPFVVFVEKKVFCGKNRVDGYPKFIIPESDGKKSHGGMTDKKSPGVVT